MNLSLQDRVALVAGSSRGIGKSIASTLLAEGCRVCITGRDATSLSETLAELQTKYGADRVVSHCGDLTNTIEIERAVQLANEKWRSLNIVVANMGTGTGKAGWQLEDAEWERLFALNFFGSVKLAQAAIPFLAKQESSSIVFVASITGVEATPAPLPYSAAKAALINYSKNLSRVVASQGIRVNCVAPGNVLFPGGTWERHLDKNRDAVLQMIESNVPLQRFGTPEEIAQLVAFLCSDAASFITGACLVADGGQTRTI